MNGKLPATVADKYAFMLTPKDERIFLSVLRGNAIHINTPGVFRPLGHLKGFGKRFRYLFDIFFPTTGLNIKVNYGSIIPTG